MLLRKRVLVSDVEVQNKTKGIQKQQTSKRRWLYLDVFFDHILQLLARRDKQTTNKKCADGVPNIVWRFPFFNTHYSVCVFLSFIKAVSIRLDGITPDLRYVANVQASKRFLFQTIRTTIRFFIVFFVETIKMAIYKQPKKCSKNLIVLTHEANFESSFTPYSSTKIQWCVYDNVSIFTYNWQRQFLSNCIFPRMSNIQRSIGQTQKFDTWCT